MEKQSTDHSAWGILISKFPQHPHAVLDKDKFTIGQSGERDLCLGEGNKEGSLLCTLLKIDGAMGEEVTIKIAVVRRDGTVRVNDRVPRSHSEVLQAGDELIFCPSAGAEFRYILRKLEDCSSKALQEGVSDLHAYIRRCILDVGDIDISFEAFPYYLSETTKDALIYSTYMYLEYFRFQKSKDHTSLYPWILLLDPIGSQIYEETLIKALAKHCGARLLILHPVQLIGETASMTDLFTAIVSESNDSSLILFVKGLDKSMATNSETRNAFILELAVLPKNIVVIASGTEDSQEWLSSYFPRKVNIQIPREQQLRLKQNLDPDNETMLCRSNLDSICSVLNRLGVSENLKNLPIKEDLTSEGIEQVVFWAVSHNLIQCPKSEAVSRENIEFALNLWKRVQNAPETSQKHANRFNDYETTLLGHVIMSAEIGVFFNDIGALEELKKILFETVTLPLQRPDLFAKGLLAKACKGMLLFGPKGTGKTMIAKAIATEAGANFINVTVSSVTSKHLGDSEKYINAIFTLAKKLAPSLIFVDEVDSLLASRQYLQGEGDGSIAMGSMNTEFFRNWDGLLSKDGERIMVLGATNRPFDLDEAAIRRFSRRLMVGLPDEQSRIKILRCILEDEALAPDFNLEEIAKSTDNYSGSDLKNLCIAAAHCRIRELAESIKKGKGLSSANEGLRPLSMEDMKYATGQVRPSVALDSMLMNRLFEWNDTYGEGGPRKTQNLSYFV